MHNHYWFLFVIFMPTFNLAMNQTQTIQKQVCDVFYISQINFTLLGLVRKESNKQMRFLNAVNQHYRKNRYQCTVTDCLKNPLLNLKKVVAYCISTIKENNQKIDIFVSENEPFQDEFTVEDAWPFISIGFDLQELEKNLRRMQANIKAQKEQCQIIPNMHRVEIQIQNDIKLVKNAYEIVKNREAIIKERSAPLQLNYKRS